MAASSGRRGRPWRRVRAAVLAESTTCHLCGHGGAGEVDHRVPRSVVLALGGDPEDPTNLAPAHGARSKCPDCGVACNQAKGDRPHAPRRVTSRAW